MKPLKLFLASAVLFLSATACLSSVTGNTPTDTPQAAAPQTAAPQTAAPQSGSSGIITEVVTAKSSESVTAAPVDPTSVFGTNSVIHAVVKISNAPANTKFTASWYVVDDGGADLPNTLITSSDLTADGTRNLDFTLTPTSAWPLGKYRVEISVNGQLDQTMPYSVK
jgi:hypothetical protein